MRGRADYRLAKRAIVADFRRGSVSRLDICDAHPELMRAARHIGRPVMQACPICGDSSNLREVSYVYGDQLKRLSGRVVYPDCWVDELNRTYDEFRCYVIEVCTACSWNHLSACYLSGRRYAG